MEPDPQFALCLLLSGLFFVVAALSAKEEDDA